MRLQKERDVALNDVEKAHEKAELLSAQLAKATRDRELLSNEADTCRERFEKVFTWFYLTLLPVRV